MRAPVIGWEQKEPIATHNFNDYLHAREGRLFYEGLDLAQLFIGGQEDQGLGRTLPSPLELIYLPKIREKIARMRQLFKDVSAEVGYSGAFHYAYASKANVAEEVLRTTLESGAHYEMSSAVDVEIAQLMLKSGKLPPERMVICNGFKGVGTDYAAKIVELKRAAHPNVIPVVEDRGELPPLVASELNFEVGLRQKSYGPHRGEAEMDEADSRFGMDLQSLWQAAAEIEQVPQLSLKLYHAMVGSQITSADDFLAWLETPIEIYARLRKQYPTLSIFDFGGGMPVPMTLDFEFDYRYFVRCLLQRLQEVCQRYAVPVPDVLGEFGRYTTAEHGAHLFKVVTVKENNSALPWYLINGSIMTSFPDSWALSEHFIVLPLTNLDQPFRRVRLGGMTCDSDDVYPPHGSASPLYLPVETEELYIGFFGIGAYQEMLGGVRGSKHCVLPEANELLVDRAADGNYQFNILRGQRYEDVLRNLGYWGYQEL